MNHLFGRLELLIWCLATSGLIAAWLLIASAFDRLVLINTLSLGLFSSCAAVPTGLLLARLCLRRGWLSKTTLLLVLAMAFVPLVFQVSFWDAAFGKLGWLTASSTGQNSPIVAGWMATAWIHAISLAPQIALIFLAAFWTGEQVHEEQALMDSSQLRVFWTVTMRRLIPILVLAVCWCVISCSREIAATDIYQVGTLAEQVYLGFSLGQFDSFLGNWTQDEMAQAKTLGIWTQVFTIAWLVATAMIFFSRFFIGTQESENQTPHTDLRTSSKGTFALSLAGVLAWLIIAAIPAYNLIARASFYVARVDGEPVQGYSIEQFFKALRRASFEYLPQTYWSVLIGIGCSLLTLSIAAIVAWNARKRRGFKLFSVGLVSVCFALPGPIVGSGLAWLMTRFESEWINFIFNRTLLPPIVATTIVCLPIAVILCYFVFDSVAVDAQEHARTEGAGGAAAFFRFGIGGNLIPLLGVGILSFIIAYGELAASQMVLPPGVETVPRLTLGLMHSGVNEMTAALTIINVGAIVGVSLLGWWLVSLKTAK